MRDIVLGPVAGPRLSSLPPLSVYVHLPWCVSKCPYCDFNSHEAPRTVRPDALRVVQTDALRAVPIAAGSAVRVDETAYLEALEADLETSVPLVWGRRVHTVFIGGGTPSLFSPEAIDRLLASLRARLQIAPDAEVTMEANPGTFERERFKGFRDAGVTRLSLGVQSFDDDRLAAIGRIHGGAEARAAAEAAGELFETFNLDLMFALPGQSLQGLETDLATALALGAPHLSCYHLTLEPNTRFARYPPALPDEDLAATMQDAVQTSLDRAGYEHYEVSAHARPGHRAQHNLNYWRFGDYLGLGAGAHGKLSFHDRIVRYARYRQPRQYMLSALAGRAVELERHLTADDLGFEFMLNALRLTDGVDVSLFAERTGLNLATVAGPIRRAVERGLLVEAPQRLAATPLGLAFLNDLQQLFLPGDALERGKAVR